MDWFSDTEKVRAPLKITFALQRSLFALTFVQLAEIAYLSHFSWPHQLKLVIVSILQLLPSPCGRWIKRDRAIQRSVDFCPLWSKSGQTWAQVDCPLCANSRHSRNDMREKERPPRDGL